MREFDIDKIAEIHRQIRVVLARDWDPIGVGDAPEAASEYFGYVRAVSDVAVATRSADAVARHLLELEQDSMGLPARSVRDVLSVGEKVVQLVTPHYASFMIDWNRIKNLEKDTRLATAFPRAEQLGERFYRIGKTAYVETWDVAQSQRGPGPFITLAAWAPTVGVARRILFADAEADDGALGIPPESLLLEPAATTYEVLRQAVETGRHGRFLCGRPSYHPTRRHLVAVERLTYFFRDPTESICGISIDYRDIRWRLC